MGESEESKSDTEMFYNAIDECLTAETKVEVEYTGVGKQQSETLSQPGERLTIPNDPAFNGHYFNKSYSNVSINIQSYTLRITLNPSFTRFVYVTGHNPIIGKISASVSDTVVDVENEKCHVSIDIGKNTGASHNLWIKVDEKYTTKIEYDETTYIKVVEYEYTFKYWWIKSSESEEERKYDESNNIGLSYVNYDRYFRAEYDYTGSRTYDVPK